MSFIIFGFKITMAKIQKNPVPFSRNWEENTQKITKLQITKLHLGSYYFRHWKIERLLLVKTTNY